MLKAILIEKVAGIATASGLIESLNHSSFKSTESEDGGAESDAVFEMARPINIPLNCSHDPITKSLQPHNIC